jgi:hypothetical protein
MYLRGYWLVSKVAPVPELRGGVPVKVQSLGRGRPRKIAGRDRVIFLRFSCRVVDVLFDVPVERGILSLRTAENPGSET